VDLREERASQRTHRGARKVASQQAFQTIRCSREWAFLLSMIINMQTSADDTKPTSATKFNFAFTTLATEVPALIFAALLASCLVYLCIGCIVTGELSEFAVPIAVVTILVHWFGYRRLRLLRRHMIVELNQNVATFHWMTGRKQRKQFSIDTSHIVRIFYIQQGDRKMNQWLFFQTTQDVVFIERVMSRSRPRWEQIRLDLELFLQLSDKPVIAAPLPKARIA
jgi:hypothetical protein